MKKIFRFMAVLATVAAALASCAKAEMDAPANEDVAGENVYQGPTRLMTFEAVTGDPQTRTSLGDVVTDGQGNKTQPVLWDADDEIKILYVADGTEYSVKVTPKSLNGNTAVFEAEVPETGVDTYYAVYPSSTAAVVDAEAGTVQLTIPVATTSFKKANIMVAKATSADRTFGFKHAVSIIRFQMGDNSFKTNGVISRLSLYSGVRGYLAGDVLCSFGSDGVFTATAVNKNELRYVTAESLSAGETAYVAVWPDYTFEKGFIAYYFNEQRSSYYENDLTVRRGEILNLGNIQDRMRTDFFIKPNGTGDGSSWEKAAGVDFIREFFAKKEDANEAYAHCQKCENTNFYFAAGTYILGTADAPKLDLYWGNAPKSGLVPIKFYGGCAATEGTDKTRNPETYQTIFSGNSEYGILSVRNKADLTLDGITLTKAVATKELQNIDGFYGAALYVAMNTDVSNNGEEFFPIVNINNCKFVDNKETESLSDEYGGGAALNIGTGKVYVHNSIISNSQAYNRGAAVRISDNAIDGTKVYFNSCVFSGNNVTSGLGHVMWIKSINGDAAFNNCNFHTNGTTGGARAVLNLCNNNIINNCTFYESTENYNQNQGIVRYIKASDSAVATYANNIVYDIKGRRTLYLDNTNYSVSSKGYNLLIGKYGTYINIDGADKTEETNLCNLTMELDESLGYYTWDGVISDFEKATADAMIAATTANSNIGDDFYDWLVQIGAIVNGQFTDCRGYLRPKDAMCPGAYDPNATQPTL